jgi:3D (Asp-Asp-Asp) domain-containing protein
MNKIYIFIIVFILISAFGLTTERYRTITVTATAYCPCEICCGKWANGTTAIGRCATLPGIAVDPKYIKLRSYIDVPGYGSWILADDTGSAIKGNKIDLRFNNHEEAKQWGVQRIKIRVWE